MSETNLKEKTVVYPPPKTAEAEMKGMKYDEEIDKKNFAKNPKIKLPLSEKKDKYGENYTDIPQLIKDLGLNIENIKDYKYDNERTKPYHNNNSGGKSKRFDMQGTAYPQFEYSITLTNESDDEGDEVSCKHWGPHDKEHRNWADTFIMMVDNDGTMVRTQIEPSHMDMENCQKFNYSGKFNNIEVNAPKLIRNTFTVRFIRLANIPTKEVIGVVAIKYHENVDDQWKDWNVIYETHVFDGQGGGPVSGGKGRKECDPTNGGRALKDPFRPWIVTALGKDPLDKENGPQITVRMDEQPSTPIKEGKHYKNARVTEIVDFERA